MYIKAQNESQLVLTGVPGRRIWMIALSGVGMLITVAFAGFMVVLYQESEGWSWSFLPLSLGVLVGQLLFWSGVVTLAVGKLSLVLDSSSGTGEYRVRSPIVEAGKPCKFKLEHVDSVVIDSDTEWRPGQHDQHETTAIVYRAKLRLSYPRRSITLEETENGRLERVERVAQAVAAFLDKPLRHLNARGSSEA